MSKKKDESIISKAYAEHIKYLQLCKQIEDKVNNELIVGKSDKEIGAEHSNLTELFSNSKLKEKYS